MKCCRNQPSQRINAIHLRKVIQQECSRAAPYTEIPLQTREEVNNVLVSYFAQDVGKRIVDTRHVIAGAHSIPAEKPCT